MPKIQILAFMYVKVIANQRWDIFWRHSVDGDGLESLKGRRRRLLFSWQNFVFNSHCKLC